MDVAQLSFMDIPGLHTRVWLARPLTPRVSTLRTLLARSTHAFPRELPSSCGAETGSQELDIIS